MSNWNQGGEREQPPTGARVARLYSIIDIGTVNVTFKGETKFARKVVFTWELPTCLMTGKYKPEAKGKPFSVSTRLTRSLAPSSTLRGLLRSWKGRDFTKEELAAFNPRNLLGKSCQVVLVQSADGQYINVDNIIPLAEGQVCPPAVNPTRYFSLDSDEFDQKAYSELPDRFKELVTASPEFAALTKPAEPDGPPLPDEPPHEEPQESSDPF